MGFFEIAIEAATGKTACVRGNGILKGSRLLRALLQHYKVAFSARSMVFWHAMPILYRAGDLSMEARNGSKRHWLPSDLLLLLEIFLLPIMKPALPGGIIVADLVFVLLVIAMSVETIASLRRINWIPCFGTLLAYVGSLVPSVLATDDIRASLFELTTEVYLIGLAATTAV